MVPGSTLRYGSHFRSVTLRPRLSSRQPMEAAATPFPREETTPPVTKIYFGPLRKFRKFLRSGVRTTYYEENRPACQIILGDSWERDFQGSPRSRKIFSTLATSAGTSTLTASYST